MHVLYSRMDAILNMDKNMEVDLQERFHSFLTDLQP